MISQISGQTLAVATYMLLGSHAVTTAVATASSSPARNARHDKFLRRAPSFAGDSGETSLYKRDNYKGGDGQDYSVLHKGSGDNTYYWDLAETPEDSACYSAQPNAVWVFAESNATTLCESPAASLQKTMKEKGDLKMVAIQRELLYNDWSLCGKEVVVSVTNPSTGETKDFGNYIVWDGCQDCDGGVDFSVSEFHNMYGDSGCTTGRFHNVTYRILDHQMPGPSNESDKWQPRKLTLGTSNPDFIDKYSGCTTEQLGNVSCTEDGSALGLCSVDSWNPSTYGRYEIYWTNCTAYGVTGGTFCDPNGAGAGYPICVMEAQKSANALAGQPAAGECDDIPIGGYRCKDDSTLQVCAAGSTQGSADWGTTTACTDNTTCVKDEKALGVAHCVVPE